MNTIFVHRDGRTEPVTSIDRSWLTPAAGVYVWVDLDAPSIPESLVLSDTFAFHRLAIEETRVAPQSPRIDAYEGYLFAAVAGADTDVCFFVGAHFIVSVHRDASKAIADLMDSVRHGGKHFAEGPFAMFHRLVQNSVDGFMPLLQKQVSCADALEKRTLEKAGVSLVADVLRARNDVFGLSQRLSREQNAVRRLASRDVVEISDEMAFRFRDLENRLARLVDGAQALEHRLGDLLTAASALAARKSLMSWM
jgi:magnesium transporter